MIHRKAFRRAAVLAKIPVAFNKGGPFLSGLFSQATPMRLDLLPPINFVLVRPFAFRSQLAAFLREWRNFPVFVFRFPLFLCFAAEIIYF